MQEGEQKIQKTSGIVFYPMMDWWVAILVGAIGLMLLATIPMILWKGATGISAFIAVLLIIAFILYLLDLAFFSRYELAEDRLIISTQLKHIEFPYREMRKIQNGTVFGLFSLVKHKRYALSGHCLTISLSKGPWRTISVSPREQSSFLNLLLTNIDRERSKRATYSKHKK